MEIVKKQRIGNKLIISGIVADDTKITGVYVNGEPVLDLKKTSLTQKLPFKPEDIRRFTYQVFIPEGYPKYELIVEVVDREQKTSSATIKVAGYKVIVKEEKPAEVVKEEVIEVTEEEVTKVAEAEVKEEPVKVAEEKEVTEVAEAKEKEEPVKVATTPSVPDEEFDWDSYEKGDTIDVAESQAELEKLYDQTLSTISEKEVLEGEVIALNKREVVINIGFKSDGIISRNEFRYNPDLKIGDKVEVFVESQEDKKGQLILSHKKARALRSWDRVNEALDNNEIIKGYIKCRTKGGMIVDVFGIEAFLPGSQIDVKPIRDYDMYVGKTMEFKVVKINPEFKNVVVSHKALIEAELEQQKKEIISKLEKGQVLEGTVKNITSYGVFIDLGGVDGLIHITDLSWGRVSHPEELVELDQKLNVVILDFDDEKKRIALGLKQLTSHPWDSLDEKLKVGDVVRLSTPADDIVTIRVDSAEGILRPGMFANVRIVVDEHRGALAVPRQAIIYEGNKRFLYVVRGGVAEKVEVETGFSDEGYIEVAGELKEGEPVVVAGQNNLASGIKVEIVNSSHHDSL